MSSRHAVIVDAIRGLREEPMGGWVADGVIDRTAALLVGCTLMHLAEAWVIDALDAEPTYPGEGKDSHVAAIMRSVHTGLTKAGLRSFDVEDERDVLVVERTWTWQEWTQFGVPPCEDCQKGVQHIHWSGDPDPSLRDTV